MRLLDEGYPLRRLARESGILRNQLRDLRKRYLAFGEDGLRRKPAHYASEAEKASVRAEIMEKALPLNEICLKYDVSESAIRNWHKIEGKPPQPMAKRKKRNITFRTGRAQGPSRVPGSRECPAKKVKALVEARDAHLKETGQKPSTN